MSAVVARGEASKPQRDGSLGAANRELNAEDVWKESIEQLLGRLAGRRIVVIAESVAAVEPGCIFVDAEQRSPSAGIDGDICFAEFNRVQGVPGGLVDVHISGDRGDGGYADVGCAESHDEGDGVVGSGVSVDEERAQHVSRIANRTQAASAPGLRYALC